VAEIRAQFPALSRGHDGRPYSYLDGPGGTQVPRRTIEAMTRYLERSNANHEGAFATSEESDAILGEAHAAAADSSGGRTGRGRIWPEHDHNDVRGQPGDRPNTEARDEVVVTRLDHDANVAPWLALQEERGVTVRWSASARPIARWT